MPRFARALLAVAAGLVTWLVLATLGNLAIRALLPDYAAVERTLHFTLPMLFARLFLGAVCSVVAGAACMVVARQWVAPAYAFALVLVLLFIPVHVGLWAKFPLWYHLIFLSSLAPLALLGARLSPRGHPRAA